VAKNNVISFIILAIYWRGHHRQFHYIKHSDGVLVWTNIMFLMAVSFLPFSTSILGEYIDQHISVFIYGGNSIVIALCFIFNGDMLQTIID
jgi:uncharacterized membrane protein